MAIISVLLVVLIIVQLAWLKSAAATEKREAKLHIEKALGRVEEQLRNTNYCIVSYARTFVNPNEKFYMVQVNEAGKVDTLNMFYQSMYVDSMRGKMRIMDAPFPFSMDIQLKTAAVINDTESYYSERKDFYEKLTGKKFNDILTSNKRIDSMFDMQIVDSLIKSNLQAENKDTLYGFAFIDNAGNKIAYATRTDDSAAMLSSPYQLQLFTDNKFIKPYRLAVLFPDMPGMYAVNSWLWLSVAVVLLLTFSFYAFIRLYIKQTRLSEMKSDFIHNLTHEFNTPMANISLAIETLEGNGKVNDPKVRNILQIISAESGRLRENIERSLQIATLEKGNLHLQKEQIDMVQVINTVLSAYQLQCEQYGGNISFAHNGKAMVYGDETHLINCVVNLLDNAIKYKSGNPEIKLTLEEKGNNILLSVADNGKGMTADTQKHIFEKFYRAHEGDIHNTKGFGLGLSYVRGILEAHGGTIEVWSKPGVGTKFTIVIPKSINHGIK